MGLDNAVSSEDSESLVNGKVRRVFWNGRLGCFSVVGLVRGVDGSVGVGVLKLDANSKPDGIE